MAGRLSRRELHELTGIRPNTVGADAGALLKAGILRETDVTSFGRGRPRVPLEIDPERRHVVGLGVRPGGVEAARLNLRGQLLATPVTRDTADPSSIVTTLCDLLGEHTNERTIGVGISMPGFVDPVNHSILFSAAAPGAGAVSLQPVYECAKANPVVLENDMHALAARWLLTHQAEQEDDVLLVYFEDGALGAAILIEGRPNRGCVTGANELGHTRFPIETDRCYCGHVGCLERICSTPFLRKLGDTTGTLADRAASFDGKSAAMSRIVELLAIGIANAVNFTRVNRLVLASEWMRHEKFAGALLDAVRERLLNEVRTRVQVDHWQQAGARSAETAGWLALANLYYEGWNRPKPQAAIAESQATLPSSD